LGAVEVARQKPLTVGGAIRDGAALLANLAKTMQQL
jgi:hypothetical protein